jgi:hypothetical protein
MAILLTPSESKWENPVFTVRLYCLLAVGSGERSAFPSAPELSHWLKRRVRFLLIQR